MLASANHGTVVMQLNCMALNGASCQPLSVQPHRSWVEEAACHGLLQEAGVHEGVHRVHACFDPRDELPGVSDAAAVHDCPLDLGPGPFESGPLFSH
jgi:hypothetical protein